MSLIGACQLTPEFRTALQQLQKPNYAIYENSINLVMDIWDKEPEICHIRAAAVYDAAQAQAHLSSLRTNLAQLAQRGCRVVALPVGDQNHYCLVLAFRQERVVLHVETLATQVCPCCGALSHASFHSVRCENLVIASLCNLRCPASSVTITTKCLTPSCRHRRTTMPAGSYCVTTTLFFNVLWLTHLRTWCGYSGTVYLIRPLRRQHRSAADSWSRFSRLDAGLGLSCRGRARLASHGQSRATAASPLFKLQPQRRFRQKRNRRATACRWTKGRLPVPWWGPS